jgi:hypothetical protein
MKKGAEIEMREEYDFSGGVRGRHAARFAADERDALFRTAAVQDLQTWTLLALYEVQALEAAVFTFLVLAGNRAPGDALVTSAALLDHAEARSLTDVLPGARYVGLEDIGRRLTFVATERTWLVHRSGFVSHAALSDPDKVPALLDRLQRLVADAREVTARIESLVSRHLSETGLSEEEAITRRNDMVGLWQTAA